jgi:hypothetical protein
MTFHEDENIIHKSVSFRKVFRLEVVAVFTSKIRIVHIVYAPYLSLFSGTSNNHKALKLTS